MKTDKAIVIEGEEWEHCSPQMENPKYEYVMLRKRKSLPREPQKSPLKKFLDERYVDGGYGSMAGQETAKWLVEAAHNVRYSADDMAISPMPVWRDGFNLGVAAVKKELRRRIGRP